MDRPRPLPGPAPNPDHHRVSQSQVPPESGLEPLSQAVSAPQVTLGLFGLRGAQAERGPRTFATLAECCKPFEPGQRYQEFVRTLQPEAPPPPPPAFSFQEFVPTMHRWAPGSRVGRSPGDAVPGCWHSGAESSG